MPDDVWMLGLALGLAVDAGLLLGLVLSGTPVRLPADLPRLATIGAAVAALGWTGLPVMVGLVRGGWAAVWAWKMRPWAQVPDDAALDRHAAPPHATREEPDAPVVSRQRAAEQHIAHWDVFWLRLARAGDAYGFTNSVLTTDGAATKVMTDDAWKKVMPYAVYSGVLVGGKPGKATKWAGDWTLERFEQEQTWKLLPHPTFEPPEIADGPYNATPQRSTTPRATPEKREITGMRAD